MNSETSEVSSEAYNSRFANRIRELNVMRFCDVLRRVSERLQLANPPLANGARYSHCSSSHQQ